MNCERIRLHIDDYLDGSLGDAEARDLRLHVAGCESCGQVVDSEIRMRRLLRDYGSMNIPDATYFDAALVRAARVGRRRQHRRSWMTGFGSAVAAGLALWVVSTVWFAAPATDTTIEDSMPLVAMTLEQPHTVNLVFSSAAALDDATLTVTLPPGIEVAGFAGKREITWRTSLREGKNLLPLKLIATLPTDGVLLATLRHGDDDRTFRFRIDVS